MDEAGRLGVELLLEEGRQLQEWKRYDKAQRAFEKAAEGARELGDLRLEMQAMRGEATAFSSLGYRGAARTRYTQLVAISMDPVRRAEGEKAGLTWEIANNFRSWVECVHFRADVPAERVFGVLDAGEAYVRSLGHPGWRSGLLHERALKLDFLGRLDEAIGAAEEGLSLMLQDGSGPGVPLDVHRYNLGRLLLKAKRHDEARRHYQSVLDDPASEPHYRNLATQGLAHCALEDGDAKKARTLAEQAVVLAEGLGDHSLSVALKVLITACRRAGDLPAARSAAERALDGARRNGHGYRLCPAFCDAIDVAIDEQDTERARALLDEAEPHATAEDRMGNRTVHRDKLRERRARLPPG